MSLYMKFLLECVENHYRGSGNTPVYGGVISLCGGIRIKKIILLKLYR